MWFLGRIGDVVSLLECGDVGLQGDVACLRRVLAGQQDDDLLKRIGWSGRRPKTDLLAPDQCRALEAPRQGEGWVFLDWKQPVDGGKPAAYKIQRRECPEGSWTDIGMSIESETTPFSERI